MCVLSVPLTVWMDYPPHQAPFRLIRYLLELKIAVCVVTSLTLCSPLPHTVQSILRADYIHTLQAVLAEETL